MKHLLLSVLLILCLQFAKAQNVQTLYDVGKGRGFLSTTVELFKTDSIGSTYFFVDHFYGESDVNGMSSTYFEIYRTFKLAKSPFALHVEYNGGFGQCPMGVSYQVNNAYLGGIEYVWDNKTLTSGFTLQAMYKTIQHKNTNSYQITCIWYKNMCKDKLSFAGYIDFWKEDNIWEERFTKFSIMSEPQLWYNVNSHIALGSELRITNNTCCLEGWHANPAVGFKYTF